MIWWVPWVIATVIWPLAYAVYGSGTLATGVALMTYGAGLITLAIITGAP